MTLLELMVGMVITGLVLAAGYAALASVADHQRRADRAAEAAQHAAGVRRTLQAWLWGARVTADQQGPEFRGIDGLDAGRPNDELSFLTSAETAPGSGPSVVRLYVDRDPRTPQRGLVAEIGQWRGARSETLEIDSHVTALQLRYLSGLAQGAGWVPSWISGSVLPRAVEMRLTAEPADSLPPLLRLPILVTYGPGS